MQWLFPFFPIRKTGKTIEAFSYVDTSAEMWEKLLNIDSGLLISVVIFISADMKIGKTVEAISDVHASGEVCTMLQYWLIFVNCSSYFHLFQIEKRVKLLKHFLTFIPQQKCVKIFSIWVHFYKMQWLFSFLHIWKWVKLWKHYLMFIPRLKLVKASPCWLIFVNSNADFRFCRRDHG